MKRLLAIFVLCFIVLVPIQASAETFTINSVTLTWDNSPVGVGFLIMNPLVTPKNYDLNPGQASTDKLFEVWAYDYWIIADATYNATITFDLTAPSGITDVSVPGVLVADNVDGKANDTFSFTFADPVYATWGNGNQFRIDLADLALTTNFWPGVFTEGFNAGPVLFTVTYVPEPTSLLLLVSGLGVLGMAAWRRRK